MPWNEILSQNMVSSWTNFGKFMEPNVTDYIDGINFEWSLYYSKESKHNVMIFRDKLEIKQMFDENYRNNVCDFWINQVGFDIMLNICNDGANVTSFI